MTTPTHVPLPKPTPGATAWVRTTETWHLPDGDHTTTNVQTWHGYTADDLHTHWAARAKNARWRRDWDCGRLTVFAPEVGRTTVRTFHDEEPA